MEAAWSTAFLLTLYDGLGRSTQPFSDFAKGQKVEAKLQKAIDFVWPGTDFKIRWSDTPCSKVSAVLSWWQLVLIGHSGWSALYLKPTPMSCIDMDSPGYIVSIMLMLFVRLPTRCYGDDGYCSNSCFHRDMQARMRVHRLSLSSQENYESSIDDYINKTISTLSARARRWRSLLELWGKGKCQTRGTGALVGTSTAVHRKLYIPPSSSPAKE